MKKERTRSGIQLRTRLSAGEITIYGSAGCPWCAKQKENFTAQGIPFTFVDCSKQSCPDVVDGFPTTVITGFHEFGKKK